MVALSFRSEASGIALDVLGHLVEASRSDPYLREIAGDGRHCHGYGYVAALRRRGLWRVVYERFDAEPSLSGEEACEANLEALGDCVKRLSHMIGNVEEAMVMVHSRRTRGEPRGVPAAHPFREELIITAEGGPELAELYLSHNGGVKKEVLAAHLGIENYRLYTDSHLYLKYLAKHLEGARYEETPQLIARIVSESKPLTKSALDLCILLYSPTKGPMLAAASYVAEKNDEKRWRYYEPVLIESKGITGYVSSTVRDLMRDREPATRFMDGRDGFVAVLNPNMLQIIDLQ
jgi:glutamine amidotransferase